MSDSSIGRVVGVLFSPTRTFEAIRERPTWLVALVVLVVLGATVGLLLSQKIDWEEVAREQLAQSNRQLSEEQMERAIEVTEAIGSKMVYLGPLLGGPVVYLLIALLFWVLLKLLGGEFSYKASFATTLHGLMPSAVAALLTVPVIMGLGEPDMARVNSGTLLASNLGAFVPEETSHVMRTALASIDVFSIWSLFLLSIGFAVVARVSRAKAATAVVALWIVYILIKVGAAALQS